MEAVPIAHPLISEVLGTLYKQERIVTKDVVEVSPGKTTVTFVFPLYDRTIETLDHVSMAQMHEAILEGLFCTIGAAAKSGSLQVMDYQTFLDRRLDALYARENLRFRRMVKANEAAELTFEITHVGEKQLQKKYHSLVIAVTGFVEGETECLLSQN